MQIETKSNTKNYNQNTHKHTISHRDESKPHELKQNLGFHEIWVTRVGSNAAGEAPVINLKYDCFLIVERERERISHDLHFINNQERQITTF